MQCKSRSLTNLEEDTRISHIQKKTIKEAIQNKWQEVNMLENEERKNRGGKIKGDAQQIKIQPIRNDKTLGDLKMKSFGTTSLILSRSTYSDLQKQVSDRIKGASKVMDKMQEIKKMQHALEEKEKRERKILAKKLEDFNQKCNFLLKCYQYSQKS